MSGSPTTRLELSPSFAFAALIAAMHAIAAACVAVLLPGAAGIALGAALLALGLAAAWRRALLRARNSVRVLELHGPQLLIELACGTRHAAQVAERRYVGRFAVSLQLRDPARTLVVTRDMLSAAAFRRLRLWALWSRLPAVAAKQLPA